LTKALAFSIIAGSDSVCRNDMKADQPANGKYHALIKKISEGAWAASLS
jgi:hypothetical protein